MDVMIKAEATQDEHNIMRTNMTARTTLAQRET